MSLALYCGTIPGMAQEELLHRIEEKLAAKGISERKACLNAKVGADFVRDIRRRGHSPNAAKLIRLARVLDTAPAYFIEAMQSDDEPASSDGKQDNLPGSELAQAALNPFYIVGYVEAGTWRPAMQLPEDEWEVANFTERPEFRGAKRFGLRVRGPSMNEYYPPGTVLDCVKFMDILQHPKSGDHVIVYRRGPGDLMEATVKELAGKPGGGWELRPRSSHADHREVISLPELPHDDESEDVRIVALVIGAYIYR